MRLKFRAYDIEERDTHDQECVLTLIPAAGADGDDPAELGVKDVRIRCDRKAARAMHKLGYVWLCDAAGEAELVDEHAADESDE